MRRTKAEMLLFIRNQKHLRKSVCPLLILNFINWKEKKSFLIEEIYEYFKNKPLVIRSSFSGEDVLNNSFAGVFETILNVSKENLSDSIDKVFNSYGNRLSNFEQIIVQEKFVDVSLSGVIFTKDPQKGGNYYVVNYSKDGKTDTITSGKDGRTLFYLKRKNITNTKFEKLFAVVEQIESLLNNDSLEIEFAINTNEDISIFQVREFHVLCKSSEIDNTNTINLIERDYINYLKENSIYKDIPFILSDMAYWNPSEIIGDNPNNLDFDLYKYLITDINWNKSLVSIGYPKMDLPLMIRLGNKPYINIQCVFYSLLPEEINPVLRKSLVELYVRLLKKSPEMHINVELEIIDTCFDFNLKSRLENYCTQGFISIEDVNLLLGIYKSHFLKLISKSHAILTKADLIVEKSLNKRREIEELLKQNKINYLQGFLMGLEDCKNGVAFYFPLIARMAFISEKILNSIYQKKIFSTTNFFKTKKFHKLQSNDDFFLRPGMYDITSMPYRKLNKLVTDKNKSNKKNAFLENLILDNLEKNSLSVNVNKIIFFLQESRIQREYLKYVYTSNLSYYLECLAKHFLDKGFSRQDISNINLKIINSNYEKSELLNLISKECLKKISLNFISFPSVFFSTDNLYSFKEIKNKPTFITKRQVEGYTVNIDRKSFISIKEQDVEGKIVILKYADPGFDKIFEWKIKGLITEFGGIGSHLAVRCSEFDLPAVIGCGNFYFKKIKKNGFISFNCKNKRIDF